uniref:Ribosome biogenesis/translation initiation ATPase RLI n=1 Tax=Fervidicoccus fontis TaxID=683846 RepID=A0A7J3SN38_9CREN
MRVAVIDYTLCKPDRCNTECVRFCPVNRGRKGVKAIELSGETGKPVIYEDTCIGCGICIKKCPFNAISIENVPDELEKRTFHRFGANGFKLFGVPIPKEGQLIGILGKNGTGKTTSIKILAGEVIPNFGDVERQYSQKNVLERLRGTELQQYFSKLYEGRLKVAHKIQYIEVVPRRLKGKVGELLEKADERGIWKELSKELGLSNILESEINKISGGELQKFLIAAVLSKEADSYIFDEPSSFLDVKERIKVARMLREYLPSSSYAFVVEHDLAVLDYISDSLVIMYGEPGVYGIVSKVYGSRAGINNFLLGYLPAENMRLRKEAIRFHVSELPAKVGATTEIYLKWEPFVVDLKRFKLEASGGDIRRGEVIGILGANGIGKTTFVSRIAKLLEEGRENENALVKFSYKPQYISPEIFEKPTVAENLASANPSALTPGSWIFEDIIKPFGLYRLRDREVSGLSGGELQKLAVAVALAKEAQIYLLDEPSAYLDVEERLAVSKTIKRLTEARGIAAFLVEHDLSIVDYICSRIMVFEGEPGVIGRTGSPLGLREGMNKFLKQLEVTFRRDPVTGRPRINKPGSFIDREQKRIGEYYYLPLEGTVISEDDEK